MIKILIVFGTRPEAIKMAPLVKEFKKYPKYFDTKVCVTAQHREMLDQVLDTFNIEPDYDLNIMKKGQDLYEITSYVLLGIKNVLQDFKADLVCVHGDTTTTCITALACYYAKIDVAHIEAGLRTDNLYSPWPEEGNRQLVGVLAKYHFAPTATSKENLLMENKNDFDILVCGNTVIDALFLALKTIKQSKELEKIIIEKLKTNKYKLQENKKIILITGHRRENFGQGFINICQALKEIALCNPDIDMVYPVHLNPNVQKPVKEILSNVQNIYLMEPLDYNAFVYLMDKAYFIITDSGGVQEEAPSLGKPVLVMRETTERPEAVIAGTVKLIGTEKKNIINEAQILLDSSLEYNKMSKAYNPYGNGTTCNKIIKFLIQRLGK